MWAQVELVERLEISQANSDANHDVRERSGRDSCGESRYPVPSQSPLLTACTEYAHYNSLPPLCKPAIDFIPRALLTKESSQNVRLPRFDALFFGQGYGIVSPGLSNTALTRLCPSLFWDGGSFILKRSKCGSAPRRVR